MADPKKFSGDFTGGKSLEDFGQGYEILKQPVSHRLLDRAPIARELAEREVVFAIVGAHYRIYTKIRGELYYANLTLVT